LPLDARAFGRERIEYRTARDFSGDVIAVCVAMSGVTTCLDLAPMPATVAVAETEPEPASESESESESGKVLP
jgi:hypothetical protein